MPTLVVKTEPTNKSPGIRNRDEFQRMLISERGPPHYRTRGRAGGSGEWCMEAKMRRRVVSPPIHQGDCNGALVLKGAKQLREQWGASGPFMASSECLSAFVDCTPVSQSIFYMPDPDTFMSPGTAYPYGTIRLSTEPLIHLGVHDTFANLVLL
ncbi:hypothetical protein BDN71DRAFT_1433854 [Pleurotus eryngii]|uniref:Uncharacterized protein n=1 Tax=Pleurotus eryngii TaxID=5323 RepID=A0A9P6DDM4_PLEER|nr:hypothetical protein BDN71DRAFT_1433854 [Pleurotus eryngii]